MADEAIREWLAWLAELVQHRTDDPPTAEKMSIYATMLRLDCFPLAAYCLTSAHALAREFEWWPAYSVMRTKLSAWCREQWPAPTLPAPREPEPALREPVSDFELLALYDRLGALEGFMSGYFRKQAEVVRNRLEAST